LTKPSGDPNQGPDHWEITVYCHL